MNKNAELELADQIALCYNDPLRFVEFAFPWGEKGTVLEKFPEGPDKWHRELFANLTDHINGNIIRRSKGSRISPLKVQCGQVTASEKRILMTWLYLRQRVRSCGVT